MKVDYHWDKLRTCVVGQVYEPSVLSFIKNNKVRSTLEKILVETAEDLDALAELLKTFGVNVLRPDIPKICDSFVIDSKILPPPITPRDHMAMIGQTFYMPKTDNKLKWNQLKGTSWPEELPKNQKEFFNLSTELLNELEQQWQITDMADLYNYDFTCYQNIENLVSKTNSIVYDQEIDSAMIIRLGKKLFFGTWPGETKENVLAKARKLFPEYTCEVIESQGHLDGCLNILAPGLILSSPYISSGILQEHFKDYEIINSNRHFLNNSVISEGLKNNSRTWLVNGQAYDNQLGEFINLYLKNWTGDIYETYVDVNVLHVDPKNIISIFCNDSIVKKCSQYNINVHPFKFRHFPFWDSGVHCLTNDLDRI